MTVVCMIQKEYTKEKFRAKFLEFKGKFEAAKTQDEFNTLLKSATAAMKEMRAEDEKAFKELYMESNSLTRTMDGAIFRLTGKSHWRI